MTPPRMPADVARAVQARAGGMCEALIPGVCTTRVEQLHHRRMRSQGGRHTVQNLAGICEPCHSWVHSHPLVARENGWIVSAYNTPDTAPMLRRGVFSVLQGDGTVRAIGEAS